MKNNYIRTFRQIELPEECANQLRAKILSHDAVQRKETPTVKYRNHLHRPVYALAALILILSLSVTAFAYGNKIVEKTYHFFSGGSVEVGIDERGDSYSAGMIDPDRCIAPMELRENGCVYLTANGEDLDITEKFSYTDPYIYEYTDSDGLRHAFVIGGSPDAAGWAEFLWDQSGNPLAGHSVFGTPGGAADAPWLNASCEALDLPWRYD